MVKLSSQSTLHKIQVLLIRYKYVNNNNDCRMPLLVMKITTFMIMVKSNHIVAGIIMRGLFIGYTLLNALTGETYGKFF